MRTYWWVLLAAWPLWLSAAASTPLVQLSGSADGEDANIGLYFGYRDLNFQLDSSISQESSFDRLVLFVPRATDANDATPFPSIQLKAGERFDERNVWGSEDGSVLILKIQSAAGARWMFVDTVDAQRLGELPETSIVIEDNQLSWSDVPAALDQRLAALFPLDPWERWLWPHQEAAIRDARAIVEEWQTQAQSNFNSEGVAAVRALMNAKALPIDPEGFVGEWKVRSIQADTTDVYVYRYFDAKIERAGAHLRLSKTTGSQRRQGILYSSRGGNDGLIFLGGATVNDDPPVGYSRADDRPATEPAQSDTVGVLYQIAPDHLWIILDATWGVGFEIYELKRAGGA